MRPVRKTIGIVLWSAFFACLILWTPQVQAASSPLISELAAFLVARNGDGEEILKPATQAKPGDVIEYHARYSNVSSGTLNKVKAIVPIPQGLEFISGTTTPPRFLASLDGKKFKRIPMYRTIVDEQGKEQRVKVKPSEYRAIQWYLGSLYKGETRVVKCRARILK